MINRLYKWILWAEVTLSWLALLILFYYTYLEIIQAPYIGFYHSATTGEIQRLYIENPQADLQVGDYLLKIGDLSFVDWREQLRTPLFPPVTAGVLLPLEIQRGDQRLAITWPVPGFNDREFASRLRSVSWMGYLFWLTGLATLLLVRPLDTNRSLFAAFFFLTSLWLVIGNTSRWGIGDSRVYFRMALCFSIPSLLHLHWQFPRPLGTLPKRFLWGVYGLFVIFGFLHWTPYIPADAAGLIYVHALVGSLLLLLAHYFYQPESRPHVRLLLYSLLFAIIPITLLSTLTSFNFLPPYGNAVLVVLPLIPGAYFYSIYRFQLGGSEFRANRLIAVYLFVIVVSTVLLVSMTAVSSYPGIIGGTLPWQSAIALTAVFVTLYCFPPFQRFVEQRLLAMPLPPMHLIETYLGRITTTLNESSLVNLLKDEVLPSLLIRESALLRIRNNEATLVYATGEPPSAAIIAYLTDQLKEEPIYRVTNLDDLPEPTWVRLGLPLKVENKLIGMWLLGRHDPDDVYSAGEVATLQTLARQTALAFANIEQAAQLQALYQASIERQEQERMKMAHFLHDAILNQAAHLYMSLDGTALTPRVENAYATLKEQIHQMVSNLRPPSLDLGLGAALEELASDLEERGDTEIVLHLQRPSGILYYPSHIEGHTFRIVQQACENALRHAHARSIQIRGKLEPNHIDLTVEDDGVGFALQKPLDLSALLANKHFGLVHMMERAEHINAELTLDSTPGQGTRVHLVWSNPGMGATSSNG